MKIPPVFIAIFFAFFPLSSQANIIWDFNFRGGAGIIESTGLASDISSFNEPAGLLAFDVLNFQMTEPVNQDFPVGDVWDVSGRVAVFSGFPNPDTRGYFAELEASTIVNIPEVIFETPVLFPLKQVVGFHSHPADGPEHASFRNLTGCARETAFFIEKQVVGQNCNDFFIGGFSFLQLAPRLAEPNAVPEPAGLGLLGLAALALMRRSRR